MKVVKNGICREIDESRKQEFLEKGYTIEGVASYDNTEALKQENEALKQQNEALKQECETLKSQIGGDTNGESEQSTDGTSATKTDKTEAAARGRK
mgnify:FL=1